MRIHHRGMVVEIRRTSDLGVSLWPSTVTKEWLGLIHEAKQIYAEFYNMVEAGRVSLTEEPSIPASGGGALLCLIRPSPPWGGETC